MNNWEKLRQVPPQYLKVIAAGRMKGKSDINPQWRLMIMNATYGECGIDWKYEITKQWTEPGVVGQVFAFVNVIVYTKVDGKWSDGVPGTGGSMLITKEKEGLHCNDEAFKMATTDALSVALKALGVAADIYLGLWDGSKYKEPPKAKHVEELPQRPTDDEYTALCELNAEIINTVKDCIRDDNLEKAADAWFSLDSDTQVRLWRAESKGGCFTRLEQQTIKTQAFTDSHFKGKAA